METGGVGSSQASSSSSKPQPAAGDRLRNLDMGVFLKLMITELQNQDPLNPMDNSQMLNQLNQIREIASNDRLSETLDAVLMGSNLATATGILGKRVKALSDGAEYITGQVDRVSIEEGQVKVHVGENVVDLKNVAEVLPE